MNFLWYFEPIAIGGVLSMPQANFIIGVYMKSLKSLLSVTALTLAISGSALANENPLATLKDVAKDNVKSVVDSAKININKADANTLQQLSGIGEKKAQAIIDYRNKVGKIKDIAELSKIDGLGSTTIEKIAPFLTF